ncbi:uncharacterized protein BT62DRAFT_1007598 [Guyanagaster necrorhizus]|uniref:HNH nuclease domain-containing protein n=1 Tax=Guyanagaster necrorhizus TaxID=856835 RepID=A0A9P7VQ25_9AGAR|nr:uncharacterized protein BT62DRAFT_1007598 [Guyanagaster necrorhizus MCA 3950]KAG7444595.1 hypothetical protein BT62DRAFT_1007598 [Guyanagaster necrorhizus MCA 3950]
MNRPTSHILSSISSSLERDTFLWAYIFPSTLLIGGFNSHLTPVSCATLRRWTKVLDPMRWKDFSLNRVIVHPYGVMSYGVEPVGEEIPPLSTEPLPTGDYGWFSRSRVPFIPAFAHVGSMHSFTAMQRIAIKDGDFYSELGDPHTMFKVPSIIKDRVRQRDQNRCLFTGSQPQRAITVSWLVPPYCCEEVSIPPSVITERSGLYREDLTVPSNATVLHRDLVPYFLNNAFSVDIDDDYRIIIFREMGSIRQLLPTHMPAPCAQDQQFDMFLRAHFRSSLRVNILRGDIREEYDAGTIQRMMGQLGVGDDNDDDEMAPLSDSRRNSVLGQAILEEVMRERIARAL